MIRVDERSGKVPSEQLMSDMGKLIDEMTRSGVLVSTAGLRPSAEGVRIRLRRGIVRLGWSLYRGKGSDRRLRHPGSQVQGRGHRAH